MTTATLTMKRDLPADPAKVFRHLTQTAHLLNWWGPEGTTIADHTLDFSRTGPWSAHMVGPTGEGGTVGGEVREVDPPRTVEFTLSFAMPDGARGPESVIRFTLSPSELGTLLTLTQTGLNPDHIEDMRNKGWNSALGRLENLIVNA
jgi:uncharacterized protein YndB with AHSA1/START domain